MSDKKLKRKAPKEHAKEFKLNTIKRGLDGKYWIVKKRKDGVKVWKKNTKSQKGGGSSNSNTSYNMHNLNALQGHLNRLNEIY